MKNKKYILTFLLSLILTINSTFANVEGNVKVVDLNNIIVSLSEKVSSIGDKSEAKLLDEVKNNSSILDTKNPKKINLSLENDISINTKYSIVSVGEGLEAGIDFIYDGSTKKILNKDLVGTSTQIEYINISTPKLIEIYLNQSYTGAKVDFKIFKELNSNKIKLDNNQLKIQIPLQDEKNYILMLALKDNSGKDIDLVNSIFDFNTFKKEQETTLMLEDIPKNDEKQDISSVVSTSTGVVKENFMTGNLNNTFSGALSQTGELTQSGKDISKVAMEATNTPTTGAKTNILLFLTFILTLSIFIYSRKSFKF